MRLLNIESYIFREFYGESIPPYIITSHRWCDQETTFKDVVKGRNKSSKGWSKIEGFCARVKRDNELLATFKNATCCKWIWIDTCCIDKRSSAEVSESINSMFRWYSEAQECHAYLADVRSFPADGDIAEVLDDFKRSEWFRRGWTLQELLAPRFVIFFTRTWEVIGHKCSQCNAKQSCEGAGPLLNEVLATITGIPEDVLFDYERSRSFGVEEKMKWQVDRRTTRIEDRAYCLLGIFEVHMPLLYGEGEKAMSRLERTVFDEMQRPWQSMLTLFADVTQNDETGTHSKGMNRNGRPLAIMRFSDIEGEVYCVCGFDDDDGDTLACDQCQTWQHQLCYFPQYVDRKLLPEDAEHRCVRCRPRKLDALGARIRQRAKRGLGATINCDQAESDAARDQEGIRKRKAMNSVERPEYKHVKRTERQPHDMPDIVPARDPKVMSPKLTGVPEPNFGHFNPQTVKVNSASPFMPLVTGPTSDIDHERLSPQKSGPEGWRAESYTFPEPPAQRSPPVWGSFPPSAPLEVRPSAVPASQPVNAVNLRLGDAHIHPGSDSIRRGRDSSAFLADGFVADESKASFAGRGSAILPDHHLGSLFGSSESAQMNQFALEAPEDPMNLEFGPLGESDLLENFDFDSFLSQPTELPDHKFAGPSMSQDESHRVDPSLVYPFNAQWPPYEPSTWSHYDFMSGQGSEGIKAFSLSDDTANRGLCPIPTCGRHVKDLKAHMLTHVNERPEKCPIPTCEYHVKGFARKYDQNRHALTHYKGTMTCGFCSGSAGFEKSFNRVDVFKRHLTSVHGVEQTPPNARFQTPKRASQAIPGSQNPGRSGACSVCAVNFPTAQDFYEHLDGCVLRIVRQDDHLMSFTCTYPECASTGVTFTAMHDLRSHISSFHGSGEELVTFDCSEPGCHRKGELGFVRKDKLHEHQRQVHQNEVRRRA